MNYITSFFSSASPEFVSAATKRVYTFRRQLHDHRDYLADFDGKVEKHVDLRPNCPAVYDQGALGSCTANAVAAAYEFDQMHQNEDEPFVPSRLFIYYNERFDDGTVKQDSGSTLRESVKTVSHQGVCPETMWPYVISKFTDKPDQACYDEAQKHKAISYWAVQQTEKDICSALSLGYPVIFGFAVYSSFESKEVAETGLMPMPKEDEKLMGGHAVMLVGYDSDKRLFIVRNSWGDKWGDHGYFYMPFDFLLTPEYAHDFWVIDRVNEEEQQESAETQTEKVGEQL